MTRLDACQISTIVVAVILKADITHTSIVLCHILTQLRPY